MQTANINSTHKYRMSCCTKENLQEEVLAIGHDFLLLYMLLIKVKNLIKYKLIKITNELSFIISLVDNLMQLS